MRPTLAPVLSFACPACKARFLSCSGAARATLLLLGLAATCAYAAPRHDFVLGLNLQQADAPAPKAGGALAVQTTLLGEDDADLHTQTRNYTLTGEARQIVIVTVETDTLPQAKKLRHVVTWACADGSDQTLTSTRALLPTPFAARAREASSGHNGNFSLLGNATTASATTVTVQKSLQGIDQTAPDLVANTVTLKGSLTVDTPQEGALTPPSLAAQSLTSPSAITLTGTGNFLPAGVSQGKGIVPPGTIIAWMDPTRTPGEGWALCDGTNGTPDLRAYFIVGEKSGAAEYALGATGGAVSVTLTTDQIPAHSHVTKARAPRDRNYHFDSVSLKTGEGIWGRGTTTFVATTQSAGEGAAHTNLPPYTTVHYYMKKEAN